VAAATEMVRHFRKHREQIQDRIFGDSGQYEINEMVELDFSVGINYGTVLFDYLGDRDHMEYCCLGDHVAFANRLMHKAARFDPDINDRWAPILLSQTAEQHIRYWFDSKAWHIDREKLRKVLHAKGYGYPSYVYGFEDDTFNCDGYETIIESISKRTRTEKEIVGEMKVNYDKRAKPKR
jgi:class 3 adenylate cyclase